ncbi:MAG: Hydroxymethylglutaryl-CoA synthase [Pseudomonadota bacterium]
MSFPVGIDAIRFYTSHYYLDLKTLAEARGVDVEKFYLGLGQHKMAVVAPDEDVVTMAADAGLQVLASVPDINDIEMLMFATESSIDQSKAAGLFVHQLLGLPARCRVVELKQACYSATAGLQLAFHFLKCHPDKKVLLIASDIARYGLQSVGESSQGGGAVAMILSANPRILAIEPESGIHSEDVMDFWRPNYREEALVDGKYSCELYLKLLQKTWDQYHARSGRQFSDHQLFCYHVPVPRLVEKAHHNLAKWAEVPSADKKRLEAMIHAGLIYPRVVGNCYSAALYLSILSTLENIPEDLGGTRLGLYSYGSGCTAEFFSAVVQPGYQQQMHSVAHQALLAQREALTYAQYERFYQFATPTDGSAISIEPVQKGRFRLAEIRQHKRIYASVG